MSKQIIVTGATGFIGGHLVKELLKLNHRVIIFSNSREKAKRKFPQISDIIHWNYKKPDEWSNHIDGADAVIHLAGAPIIDKKWNDEYKAEIYQSRQISTKNIAEAILQADKKPEVFITASAIGYYGASNDDVFTEASLPGNDFIAKVVAMWETEAAQVEQAGIRRVSIRTGIVLDKNEGALARMLTPYKFFVGGPLGSGKQWFSWIHIDDLIKIYLRALWNEKLNGPINATAPNPVTMNQFASSLGRVMHRPSIFKVPGFIIKLIIGEAASTILTGQKVIPQKLIDDKYEFIYPDLELALRQFLSLPLAKGDSYDRRS